jgi:hypothetical protein
MQQQWGILNGVAFPPNPPQTQPQTTGEKAFLPSVQGFCFGGGTGQIRESRKFINHYEQTYSEEGLKQSKLWPKGTLCLMAISTSEASL